LNTRIVLPVTAIAVVAALGLGFWWGREAGPAPAPVAATAGSSNSDPGRILYYRHPMGLPDTSPVPKKDSMGMDYVPVYEGEAPTGPGFVVPADRLQRLGVRTTEAAAREIARVVRAVGTVEVDERLVASVSPKFDGYVTRLHVATTGALVRRGQPLLEVYSPELVTTQREYVIARRNRDALGGASPDARAAFEDLVAATRERLGNWDIDARDLEALERGTIQKNVLLRSPADGVVLEKLVKVGQRFSAGESLYQVADLQDVWLVANVFEQDLAAIAVGRPARATFEAYPGRVFEGRVAFVYPTVAAETRTVAVRIEFPKRDGALKPGLYGSVQIVGPVVAAPVSVPESAVLDSGTRQVVFAAHQDGRFEAREVVLGARGDGYVAVLKGLEPGQPVVVNGNFLIDA
jgi:Cu(I)/Ag(I) efflux system membrane fusion protein